jgi:ADP-heptose:LPS heptosyltransferase
MPGEQMIPAALLEKSGKILFIAHLAIGDFTYLQSCLRAFSIAFPHIAIHVWVDELRRTGKPSEWEHLKKYSLYDWLEACPFIKKIYRQTYSPDLYRSSIREAIAESYPIVISLGLLRRKAYARLSRKISPGGFIAGQTKRSRPYDLLSYLAYQKLDARIPAYSREEAASSHISEIYAGWFQSLFGLELSSEERFPFIDIPKQWQEYAGEQFQQWRISTERKVFLNSFSKGIQRNWPLERIIELIKAMRATESWHDTVFIVNVIPEELESANRIFSNQKLEKVYLFSAVENFFQLPAVLELCDLVITVETAIMHLANAVHVPVIALMRRTNPEWKPIDASRSIIITTVGEKDWIETIGVEKVIEALASSNLTFQNQNAENNFTAP